MEAECRTPGRNGKPAIDAGWNMESDDLKRSPMFESLDDDELSQVLRTLKEKPFSKGDVIMQEGEPGDTMYLVIHGELEVTKGLTMKFGDDDFRETEKVLNRIGPEDHPVLGEMALIAREKRSASIVAVSDGLLLEMQREDFIGMIETLPRVGNKLLMKISELLVSRLRQSSEDITRLTTALSIALSK
jgi:CRP-like cAMP-binding protein